MCPLFSSWTLRAWLLISLVLPCLALGQAVDDGPPEVSLRTGAPIWLGYILMFLFTVAVIAISLFPSKRGHLD